jgi:hypothetical protein
VQSGGTEGLFSGMSSQTIFSTQGRGREEGKYCHSLCNQQQKYHPAHTCTNNNILLNHLRFVRYGGFTAVLLNYRLLGFELWNLVEIDCLSFLD